MDFSTKGQKSFFSVEVYNYDAGKIDRSCDRVYEHKVRSQGRVKVKQLFLRKSTLVTLKMKWLGGFTCSLTWTCP